MKRRAKRRVYKPVSFETMRRIIQNGRFPDAMRQAYGGDLEPLHEYLRTHLPADHVDEIAAFHQRRLRRDFKRALKPAEEAAHRIVAIAKKIKRYGGKISRGDYQRAIDRVTEMLDVDGELSGVDRLQLVELNKSMLNALRRGKKRSKA
jgi:hypothetical protein